MALVKPAGAELSSASPRPRPTKIQIESFSSAPGPLLSSTSAAIPATNEGLAATDAHQQCSPGWNGPYSRGGVVPNDPWGHILRLSRAGERVRHTTSSRSDDRTVRKAAVERQPTSSAARAEALREAQGFNAQGFNAEGFALIEILCVLAIIGLLAAIILPAVPRATTRAKLESFAVQTADCLESRPQRAALRRRGQIVTLVDAPARSIRSGVERQTIRLPDDVRSMQATLASRCADRSAGPLDRLLSPRACRAAARSRWRGREWAMRCASTG